MNKFQIVVLLLVVALLVTESDAWRRRRRRRRRRSGGGSWGISNGGVTYTFGNGVSVTGTGGISPPSVGISVSIPFGRKRRDVEDIKEDEDIEDEGTTRERCSKCLDVQLLEDYDSSLMAVMNETNADFAMIASYEEENYTKKKNHAHLTFEVTEVIKSSLETIEKGETFTIDADLSRCKCLKHIETGIYIVLGKLDSRGKLVISGNLIEMLHI